MKFWKTTDRLGPDILGTHYKLYFKKSAYKLCNNKFKYFGEGAEFRPGAYAYGCSKIHIGNRVVVRPTSMLFADNRENGAEIVIEDGVLMGSGVQIYVVNHKFDNPEIPIIDQGHYDSKPVILKKGCWLGANVIVLPGVTIGENSVIGAGSIVSKNIPEKVLAAGNPAKVIRSLSIQ
ncbi:MAG: hypothetical protein K9J13_01265 [Saprospiraceae bacterium]|nr:hypothetical protein [Saprospiraceae bacterium]